MADRRQPRLPISLEVAYRTAGAFLVSYSINLSKGGIFLETATPLEIGEKVSLSFDVPGVGPLAVEGSVAWVRTGTMDGLPDGMGIQFDQLDQQYGEIIDEMVRGFVGLTVLVIAASPDRLALIGRYVRSIITCEIIEATNASVAEVALDQGPDLVLVDLDLMPEMGLRCIRAAKERALSQSHPTPVILLAGDARVRAAGKTSGADEGLATPPSYHELQAAVIRMLSRPASVK
jgi:uncharacterized protein (TIGR02266 family)